MSNQTVNSGKEQKQRDPDLAAAEIAMKRAAQRARERAKRIEAGVVVLKDNHIVEEKQNMRMCDCIVGLVISIKKAKSLKFLYQQSLIDLERFKGVLSQKTFKGDLD